MASGTIVPVQQKRTRNATDAAELAEIRENSRRATVVVLRLRFASSFFVVALRRRFASSFCGLYIIVHVKGLEAAAFLVFFDNFSTIFRRLFDGGQLIFFGSLHS